MAIHHPHRAGHPSHGGLINGPEDGHGTPPTTLPKTEFDDF